MNEDIQTEFEPAAQVFRALANPSRLFIVHQLADGPRCVCELTEMIGSDMSTISRHLGILRQAGIIQAHKVGQQVHYRLRIRCALDFFKCVDRVRKADAKTGTAAAAARSGC